jgi:hypothetical protein
MEDGMMARQEGGQLSGILLGQRCAAFDVGKQKRNSAGGQFRHRTSPMILICTAREILSPTVI